jgi:hypothetical protein
MGQKDLMKLLKTMPKGFRTVSTFMQLKDMLIKK